jgi:hypothetical protein
MSRVNLLALFEIKREEKGYFHLIGCFYGTFEELIAF